MSLDSGPHREIFAQYFKLIDDSIQASEQQAKQIADLTS